MHKNTKSVANAVLSVVLLVSVMSMSFSGTGLAFAQDGATSTPTAVEPTATLGVTAEPTQAASTEAPGTDPSETPALTLTQTQAAPEPSATPEPTAEGSMTPTLEATATPEPSPTGEAVNPTEPSPTGPTLLAATALATQPTPENTAEPTNEPTADPSATPTATSTAEPTPVVISATVNKLFTPTRILPGQVSTLTISLYNTSIYALTDLALTDNLPEGMRVFGSGNPGNSCGGSLSASGNTVALTGGSLPASPDGEATTCVITVEVTVDSAGTFINTIPEGGLTGIAEGQSFANTTPASATIIADAITPPTLSKSFNPTTRTIGAKSKLTITLWNNDLNSALTGLSITDTLPSGLTYTDDTAVFDGCGSGTASVSGATASFTGITIAKAATSTNPGKCVITLYVTGAADGSYTNTLPAGAIKNDQNVTNAQPASATLNIQSIYFWKAFNPTGIKAGETSTVSISIANNSSETMQAVELTDAIPAGLLASAPFNSTNCGSPALGVNQPDQPGQIFSASNGTIAPGTTCTISFSVTHTDKDLKSPVTITNSIPGGTLKYKIGDNTVTYPGGTSAKLTVNPTGGVYYPSNIAKTFSPSSIEAGDVSTMKISIPPAKNYDGTAVTLTNYQLVDTFPSNLLLVYPLETTITNCGSGTVSGSAQGISPAVLTLSGASVGPDKSCVITVKVTSNTVGSHTNTIKPANISNDQNIVPANDVSAKLTVTNPKNPDFTISKVFESPVVVPNGASILKISLVNNSDKPITDVAFTDSFPSGVTYVSTQSLTCDFTQPNLATPRYTKGVLPPAANGVPGLCVITINVKGSANPGTYKNTIWSTQVTGNYAGTVIRPSTNAEASLTVTNLKLEINKGFNPVYVHGGAVSTLTIQLKNPLTADLTGISFTDNMPAGMIVAEPVTTNVGTCGGSIAAQAKANTFNFSGGTLKAGTTCAMTLNVTMTTNFNLTNIIPVGAVSSNEGISNDRGTQASLSNLPGISITKNFADELIQPGASTRLAILLQNTLTQDLTGARFSDNLPTGLSFADPSSPANTCGGTLTALPGGTQLTLEGGALPAGSSCEVSALVTGTMPGAYRNLIPVGALTTDQGASNKEPTEDTVTIPELPAMTIVKKVSSGAGPYLLGDTAKYLITATNTGNVDLTNVTISDNTPCVTLGSCTPAQGSTLAPEASMSCEASYVIQEKDVIAKSFRNVATAESDQTDPIEDDETVPVVKPGLSLEKVASSGAGPYKLGDTVTYSLTATNTGDTALTGVTIADNTPGVTLGACTPAQPANLQPGEKLVCQATHVITETDATLGYFDNTATADSNETPPVSDDETVTVTQLPKNTPIPTQPTPGPTVTSTQPPKTDPSSTPAPTPRPTQSVQIPQTGDQGNPGSGLLLVSLLMAFIGTFLLLLGQIREKRSKKE